MNADKILPVAKRHLLLANAIVWGAPGIKILVTGIQSYLALWPSKSIVWLAVGTVLVLAGFVWMFNRIVKKYADRILDFPQQKKSILAFLPVKGWILVFFMMCLGISLKTFRASRRSSSPRSTAGWVPHSSSLRHSSWKG